MSGKVEIPQDVTAAIGLFCEALRNDAEKTLKSVADDAGVSASTIANLEAGKQTLVSTVYAVAQVFGYGLAEFIEEALEVGRYTTPRL